MAVSVTELSCVTPVIHVFPLQSCTCFATLFQWSTALPQQTIPEQLWHHLENIQHTTPDMFTTLLTIMSSDKAFTTFRHVTIR